MRSMTLSVYVHTQFCQNVRIHVFWGPSLSLSLGDRALELEFSLLINSKSAQWGENRRRIEKDNKGLPCSLHFTQLHLSPLTLLHRPLARHKLQKLSECRHVNTKLLVILHLLTVRVCLQSTALQPFITNILNSVQNRNKSSSHTLLFKQHKLQWALFSSATYFQSCIQHCVNLRGCLQ